MAAPTHVWERAQRYATDGKAMVCVIEQRRPWKPLQWRIVAKDNPTLRKYETILGRVGPKETP